MQVPSVPPLEYLSRQQYESKIAERVPLKELMVGSAYIARYILKPQVANQFAAEYMVEIEDVTGSQRHQPLARWRRHEAKAVLLPLPPDGEAVMYHSLEQPIRTDGILYMRAKLLLNNLEVEQGYLLEDRENYEIDWELSLQSAPPAPSDVVPAY